MIKVVGLFKRKAGTTAGQFRSYYENNHVKMFEHLRGLAGRERYVRRYLTPVRHSADSGHATGFDVMTENWFSPQPGRHVRAGDGGQLQGGWPPLSMLWLLRR